MVDNVLHVECPWCYARPGEPCRLRDGTQAYKTHSDRRKAARRNEAMAAPLPIPQRKSIVDGQEYDDDDGDYVLYVDYVNSVVARESRMTAMQQVLDQWTNRENVQRLIELAQEANALMFANGEEAERARIRAGVVEHYKVAPKAADSILRIIDGEA